MKQRNIVPVSRRSFIAATAASLAATAAGARTVRRAGLVGCGQVGRALLDTLDATPVPVQVDVVADANPDRLPPHSNGRKTTTIWEHLLDDHRLDALLIATPDRDHAPMARAALDAGKSVYLVPPLAHTQQQLQELRTAALSHPGRLYLAVDGNSAAHWTAYANALQATPGERPRWIQTDIPVPSRRGAAHWSEFREWGAGDGANALASSLNGLMRAFKAETVPSCTLFGGAFLNPDRETADTLTLAGGWNDRLRLTLSARESAFAPAATTVRTDVRTLELASYPGTPRFDVDHWARNTQKTPNSTDLDRAFDVQRVVLQALDRLRALNAT